jgi:hypothetical protein
MMSYYGLGQELIDLGVLSKVSKNLQLFSNLRVDPAKKTEVVGGFKIRFPEWNITGTLSSKGKATSLYKR